MLTSRAAAARYAGVTRPTISAWIKKGLLPEDPGWTKRQVTDARKRAERSPLRRPREHSHGLSGWDGGCRCDVCRTAKNSEDRRRRRAIRAEWWAQREDRLVDALADGVPYADAMDPLGVTWQALHDWRRIDPDFGRRVDDALMEGRPDVSHGTPSGWRHGCRCPECRGYHNGTRT